MSNHSEETTNRSPSARILNTQMEQGWSTQTLEMLSRRFIEQSGLAAQYASFLEEQAREENDISASSDEALDI